MTEFTLYSLALNLIYLAIALGFVRGALWYMNKSTGVKFSDVLRTINANPVAAALYYGMRILACCVLASALLR